MFSLKLKSSIIALILLSLLTTTVAMAQGTPTEPNNSVTGLLDRSAKSAGYSPNTDEYTLAEIVGTVVQAFLSLIGVIFICYTLYGGFLWMTAGGNDEKVSKSKDIIRNGVIGLIIVFSAAAIYYFVISVFNFTSSGQAGPTVTSS